MRTLLNSIAALSLASLASAQVLPYSQDFESLDQMDVTALNPEFVVGANVFDSMGGYLYGYFAFPAPNDAANAAFSLIATGEGGPPQGDQVLVTFSDYLNGDHMNGHLIDSLCFREHFIDASDVGKTYEFSFDAKLGDIASPTTADSFLKVLDAVGGSYAEIGGQHVDMTSIPTTWQRYELQITIDAAWVGQLLQYGWSNVASNYDPSGNYYDNIEFGEEPTGGPGTNYCTASANSVSAGGAIISATGSTSVAANDIVLTAGPAPANEFGVFFHGGGMCTIPFGEGLLCAPGGIVRIWPPVSSGGSGILMRVLDNTGPGGAGIADGVTRNFQCWYRDPSGGPNGFNLSDGLSITFTP
jgi:hypothetical protein